MKCSFWVNWFNKDIGLKCFFNESNKVYFLYCNAFKECCFIVLLISTKKEMGERSEPWTKGETFKFYLLTFYATTTVQFVAVDEWALVAASVAFAAALLETVVLVLVCVPIQEVALNLCFQVDREADLLENRKIAPLWNQANTIDGVHHRRPLLEAAFENPVVVLRVRRKDVNLSYTPINLNALSLQKHACSVV